MKLFMGIVSLFLLAFRSTVAASPHPKLLVVSYDGFRYDYLDLYQNLTPTLNKLKSSSSYAQCLLNVFPTQTFPNHFSIATGVYPGVHGVLGSKVYDKETGKILSTGYDLYHYNDDIVPIWTLNEKAGEGRHSGVIMWPGSEFAYGKTNSTFTFLYNSSVPFEERVARAMSWFMDPNTPANLILLYFEQPDAISHAFGPKSLQNMEMINRVDKITQYILDSLINNNLTDVNLVFLSDHGMESVTNDRIIDLTAVVGNITNMYGTSPVLHIYPKAGFDVMEVYSKLKLASKQQNTFSIYLQEDIPDHFYMKNCRRAPPILAVAEPTYAFQDLYDIIDHFARKNKAPKDGTHGVHGYDPRSINMHPFFIAHGPLFKENYSAGKLKTIDMYSMFAHVLNLRDPTSVKPNGTFAGVAKLFKSSAPANVAWHAYIIFGAIFCIVAISATAVLNLKKRMEQDQKTNWKSLCRPPGCRNSPFNPGPHLQRQPRSTALPPQPRPDSQP